MTHTEEKTSKNFLHYIRHFAFLSAKKKKKNLKLNGHPEYFWNLLLLMKLSDGLQNGSF